MKSSKAIVLCAILTLVPSLVLAADYHVNGTTGNDLWDGLAPAWDGTHGPKKTIQAGIDAASDGDTVHVAEGTYAGAGNRDLDFAHGLVGDTREITLTSDGHTATTIIDCQAAQVDPHRGFCLHSAESPDAVVDGFTIRNGYSDFIEVGGGIWCDGSSPTITRCSFGGNQAGYGGGIGCTGTSAPNVTECTFSGNAAFVDGGAVFFGDMSTPTVSNCVVSSNTAGNHGGFMYNYRGTATITNCMITNNSASYGGAMTSGGPTTLTNCTIAFNTAWSNNLGSGIFTGGEGVATDATVTNCILWGNTPRQGRTDLGTAAVRYSDVQGGQMAWHVEPAATLMWGPGNVDADPLFTNPGTGDYHLTFASPCIDRGTASGAPMTDFENNARWDKPGTEPDPSIVDIGADEYTAPNQAPVADANGPYIEPATSWEGAEVTLDGSASYDPDGDPLTYSWMIEGVQIGDSPVMTWQFPIGVTDDVSLTVTDLYGASDTDTTTVTVTVIDVAIDIKPGSDLNSINPGSHGVVPVAFLTTEDFDAASIDPATIAREGHDFFGLVKMRGKKKQTPMASMKDADHDGDLDLVVHLQTSKLALEPTATSCTLGALTWDGLLVRGSDAVNIVPKAYGKAKSKVPVRFEPVRSPGKSDVGSHGRGRSPS